MQMDDLIDLPYDKSTLFEDGVPPEIDTGADKLQQAPKKTYCQRRRLLRIMSNHHELFFRNNSMLNVVVDFMFERRFSAGDVVFNQGDPGNHFYIIDSGQFEVIKDGELIQLYHNQGSFGSRCLYRRTERPATITAVTRGRLWELDCHTIRRCLARKRYLQDAGELVERKCCSILS